MKEVLTVQRKNCLPCSKKTRYRAAVKSAYRAQSFIDMQVRNLYEERHGKLRDSLEAEMFNSIAISSCRCCGGKRIKANGHTSNGVKRYKCRDCGKTFTPVTGTLFSDHRIPVEEWIDFCLQLFSDQSFLSISRSNRNSYTTTRYWVAEYSVFCEHRNRRD